MRVWDYSLSPPPGGDARKIVTLEDDGMRWVGIRAFHATEGRWYNGNEPERARVIAWRNLDTPAKGFWLRGRFSDQGDAIERIDGGCMGDPDGGPEIVKRDDLSESERKTEGA